MDKMKLTPQQGKIIKALITKLGKKKILKYFLDVDGLAYGTDLDINDVKWIYALSLDRLMEILIGQYDIAYPKLPNFIQKGFKVSFNQISFERVMETPDIYIKNADYTDQVCSLSQAEFLRDCLTELIKFYYNNKQNVKQGE